MRMLTERGLWLKRKLLKLGFQAVECYPGAAQDLWGIPLQHKDRLGLFDGLRKLGLHGLKKTAPSDKIRMLRLRLLSADGFSLVRG